MFDLCYTTGVNHIKSGQVLETLTHPFSTDVRGIDTMSDHTPTQPETKEIPLTQGKVAIVDASDYAWLMQWKWSAANCGGIYYAVRSERLEDGKRSSRFMHRTILGIEPGTEVDHIDGDGLNNARCNLRPASRAENQRNRGMQKNNTSGYKGVSLDKRYQRWYAHINIDGKMKHLGSFDTPEAASRAYEEAARIHYGDFVRL